MITEAARGRRRAGLEEHGVQSPAIYDSYISYVNSVVSSKDLSNFKSNKIYRGILEHCSQEFGKQFYSILRNEYNITDHTIEIFCSMNDSIGDPLKYKIGTLRMLVSPASVLYLQHASMTLRHMRSLNLSSVHMVEVGCGYGGYLLAMDYLSREYGIRIESYTCIDLDPVSNLQSMYLSNFKLSFPVTFQSASTYGKNVSEVSNLFFVSIYCFSEVSRSHQLGYMEHLIPKTSHGLIIWNMSPFFDIGKSILYKEPEVPCTGPGNLLVLF